MWLTFVTTYLTRLYKGKNKGIESDSRHIVGRDKADVRCLARTLVRACVVVWWRMGVYGVVSNETALEWLQTGEL